MPKNYKSRKINPCFYNFFEVFYQITSEKIGYIFNLAVRVEMLFKTDPESDPDLNLFKYTFISDSMLKTLK